MIDARQITGLVLAGGLGRRMGGADKAWLPCAGRPLVAHAIERLAPQVGAVIVNANRHLERYAALGIDVWPDALPDHPGPLAGMATALARCVTPCLATVPCDAPRLPRDLVARLAIAMERQSAELAFATVRDGTGLTRAQPVCCLMRRELAPALHDFLQGGERRVQSWLRSRRWAEAVFDDPDAFINLNTPEELRQFEAAEDDAPG